MEPTQKPITVVYRAALLSLVVMAAFVLLIIFGHRGHKAASVADPLIVAAKYKAPHAHHRSTMANPQVIIGGAYVSCPGTGTTAPASGAWQVLNSGGTVVDTGSSPGSPGANNLFNVGTPPSAGGAVNVKALSGASAGAGYTFRSIYTAGSSSGPFDVVTTGGGGGTTARRPPIFF